MNPVDRGREFAAAGKREALDEHERLQVYLREMRLRHTWQAKPFLAPSPFENPAGRVTNDEEMMLILAGLVKVPVRNKLLEERRELLEKLKVEPPKQIAPKLSVLERAISAIKADPNRSNVLIAKEIGASEPTVRRARKEVATNDEVDDEVVRIGADGKRRKLPKAANDDRDEADPRSARIAFALRADAAWQLANYPVPITEIDEDCRKIVEAAAKSWAALAQKLREEKS